VIESLETVGKWMSWCHAGYQEEEAAAWITRASESWSRASAFEFGIFSCVDGTLHGVCGLNCIVWPNRVANLGYWIRQSAQGRGIASAAVKRLAQFGFEELGLTRIEIVTAEDNTGSRRVAERSGALFEAVLRNRLVVAGKPTPGALYSLIPSD
jgi:RimJ/RimL family protein N-acetyltransferase